MVDHGMFALDLEDGVTHDAGFAMHEESEEEMGLSEDEGLNSTIRAVHDEAAAAG